MDWQPYWDEASPSRTPIIDDSQGRLGCHGRPSGLPAPVLADILEQQRRGGRWQPSRTLNDTAVPTSQGRTVAPGDRTGRSQLSSCCGRSRPWKNPHLQERRALKEAPGSTDGWHCRGETVAGRTAQGRPVARKGGDSDDPRGEQLNAARHTDATGRLAGLERCRAVVDLRQPIVRQSAGNARSR